MLNQNQIKLLQTALRAAGLRGADETRYRLLLSHYRVASSKQLTQVQLDDLLAICEGLGWCRPGYAPDHYRRKTLGASASGLASTPQRQAIRHLAGDLGWDADQLAGLIRRLTGQSARLIEQLTNREAYNLIEAMKAMVNRKDQTHNQTLMEFCQC